MRKTTAELATEGTLRGRWSCRRDQSETSHVSHMMSYESESYLDTQNLTKIRGPKILIAILSMASYCFRSFELFGISQPKPLHDRLQFEKL